MSIFRICSGKFFTEQAILAGVSWNPRGIACVKPIRRSTSNCTNAVSRARMRPQSSRSTTWSWTARIIFRRDICQTTSAFLRASRMSTAPSFVLRDKPPCSRLIWAARVTAACFQSRLRQIQFQTVRKRECLAFCPGLSGCCRQSRRSS